MGRAVAWAHWARNQCQPRRCGGLAAGALSPRCPRLPFPCEQSVLISGTTFNAPPYGTRSRLRLNAHPDSAHCPSPPSLASRFSSASLKSLVFRDMSIFERMTNAGSQLRRESKVRHVSCHFTAEARDGSSGPVKAGARSSSGSPRGPGPG